MEIVTNNVPRPVIYGYELSEKEKQEFDYLDDIDNAQFFRYKGAVYDIGEFQRVTDTMENCLGFNGWHAYLGDSFFSGIVVRYVGDCDDVIIGRWYS